MCRNGFRANCEICGREVTCRDDYPICNDGTCGLFADDED